MHLTLLSLTDIRVQTSGMYDKKKMLEEVQWSIFQRKYILKSI